MANGAIRGSGDDRGIGAAGSKAGGSSGAQLASYHLVDSIGLRHGVLIIGLYIVATCGPLLLSSFRSIFWFSIANLAAFIVLARLCASGFTSLWCFYAALLSGATAWHLRYTTLSPVVRT